MPSQRSFRLTPVRVGLRAAEPIGFGLLYLWTWERLTAPLGVGSPFERGTLGATVLVVLWGAALGAQVQDEWERWRPAVPLMAFWPGEFLRAQVGERIAPLLAAGGAGLLLGLVGTLLAGGRWAAFFTSVWVWGGVLLTAAGAGSLIRRGVSSVSLAVAGTLGLFAVPLSLFAWGPELSDRATALRWYLQLNPMSGLLQAWRLRSLFWSPIFYGRLPYAEYAVPLWGPISQGLFWLTVGVSLLLAQGLWERRYWFRTRRVEKGR